MSFLTSIIILYILVSPLKTFALSIPRFEPNVIDTENILNSSDKIEINSYINEIRKNDDILVAVYIFKSLNGETIEDHSARVFKKWQLGEKGKDNGLLLALAMNDRKSRIEIGYGLEGDLPDLITKQALVEKLRPEMQKNNVKVAILNTLKFLSEYKQKKLVTSKATESAAFNQMSNEDWETYKKSILDAQQKSYDKEQSELKTSQLYSLIAFGVYTFCLWFSTLITRNNVIKLSRKLEVENPTYPYKIENDSFIKKLSSKKKIVIANTFFTLNPGLFIYLFSHYWLFSALLMILFPILAIAYYRTKTKRYSNLASHQKFIEKLKIKNQNFLEKGYIFESSYGEYQYTSAFYSSPDYKSSSSSSSSNSSSSSSRGGRSGGGGASSNW